MDGVAEFLDPVHGVGENGAGERRRTVDVDAAAAGPFGDLVDGACEQRVVETDLDIEVIENRRERVSAGELRLAAAPLCTFALGAMPLEAVEFLGTPDDHVAADRVPDGEHGTVNLGIAIGEELGEHLLELGLLRTRDGAHRRALSRSREADPATDERRGSSDELGNGKQLGIGTAEGVERLDSEDTLGVSDRGDRRDLVDVETFGSQRAERTKLGEEHCRHRHRRRAQSRGVGNPVMLGVLVIHVRPTDRVESRGARDRQRIAHRREQYFRLADDRRELIGNDRAVNEVAQRLAPSDSLPSEGHGVGRPAPELVRQRGGRLGLVFGFVPVEPGSGLEVAVIDSHESGLLVLAPIAGITPRAEALANVVLVIREPSCHRNVRGSSLFIGRTFTSLIRDVAFLHLHPKCHT